MLGPGQGVQRRMAADSSPSQSEADALAKLATLRGQVQTLETRQKQHERLLESWRRAAASASTAAAINEGLLTSEVWQLEQELAALQRTRAADDTQRRRALEAREAEVTRATQAASEHRKIIGDEDSQLQLRVNEVGRREQLNRDATAELEAMQREHAARERAVGEREAAVQRREAAAEAAMADMHLERSRYAGYAATAASSSGVVVHGTAALAAATSRPTSPTRADEAEAEEAAALREGLRQSRYESGERAEALRQASADAEQWRVQCEGLRARMHSHADEMRQMVDEAERRHARVESSLAEEARAARERSEAAHRDDIGQMRARAAALQAEVETERASAREARSECAAALAEGAAASERAAAQAAAAREAAAQAAIQAEATAVSEAGLAAAAAAAEAAQAAAEAAEVGLAEATARAEAAEGAHAAADARASAAEARVKARAATADAATDVADLPGSRAHSRVGVAVAAAAGAPMSSISEEGEFADGEEVEEEEEAAAGRADDNFGAAAAESAAAADDCLANWELLADRAHAVGTHGERLPQLRSTAAARPILLQTSDDPRRVLHEACAMLRVRHVTELLAVLGQVVRVAVLVPQLERLRQAVPPSSAQLLLPDSAPLDRQLLLQALVGAQASPRELPRMTQPPAERTAHANEGTPRGAPVTEVTASTPPPAEADAAGGAAAEDDSVDTSSSKADVASPYKDAENHVSLRPLPAHKPRGGLQQRVGGKADGKTRAAPGLRGLAANRAPREERVVVFSEQQLAA